MRGRVWLIIPGAFALLSSVAAAVLDVAVLALVAGLVGLAACGVAMVATRRGAAEAERAGAAERKIDELTGALAAAEASAAEAEKAADAAQRAAAEADAEAGPDVAVTDPQTGLFGEGYFDVTVASRVSAARRHLRPVAVALIEVVEGARTGHPVAADASIVADALRRTLREADTACRLSAGRFGLVLEDTPENGAVWTAERVRRALAAHHGGMTLWAGIACYPAHAFEAGELRARADRALEAAREWRQDRIEVATADVT